MVVLVGVVVVVGEVVSQKMKLELCHKGMEGVVGSQKMKLE
jgi:hypothetical protein